MTRLTAYSAVLLVALLLGGMAFLIYRPAALGWFGYGSDDPFAPCRNSQVAAGKAAIGGPFELVRMDGVTVTDADVLTKPSLIYFGYTYCPDVCPLDNARNAEAVDLLAAKGYDVQPVFISIDPERDTPEAMASFAEFMHPKMVGLTGTPEQVKAASTAYKTYYRKNGEGDGYLMDHSTFTYFMLPGEGFVEFYKRGDSAAAMAEGVACFIDNM
ncbi:MAG: SCO family protein [Rhodobacteraceae bacterium]|nr:SCO family protein [Paracoccaceae bacterium]